MTEGLNLFTNVSLIKKIVILMIYLETESCYPGVMSFIEILTFIHGHWRSIYNELIEFRQCVHYFMHATCLVEICRGDICLTVEQMSRRLGY